MQVRLLAALMIGSHSCCAAICDIAKAAKRLDKKCGLLKVPHSCLARNAQFSLSVHQDRLESTTTAAEQLAKVPATQRVPAVTD